MSKQSQTHYIGVLESPRSLINCAAIIITLSL